MGSRIIDTYVCIALFNKQKSDGFSFQRFKYNSDFKADLKAEEKYNYLTYESIEQASKLYGSNQWIFFDDEQGYKVFSKIYEQTSSVRDKFDKVFQGIPTSKDSLYVVQKLAESEHSYTILVNPDKKAEKPPIESKTFEVEKTFFKPFLMGKDVHRYDVLTTDKLVFFPYVLDGKAKLISLAELQENYPLTYAYVITYEKVFKARERGKAAKLADWFAYLRVQNLDCFEQQKLSSMEICSKHPNVTVNDKIYHSTTVYSWVKNQDNATPYQFYAAIFNSALFWWFLKNTGDTLQGDARRMKTNYLNPFPLPEQPTPEQEAELVSLVQKVMAQKQANPKANTAKLEEEINEAVYKLYQLTEEEKQTIKSGL